MERDGSMSSITNALGLGRLCVLLFGSIVGIAALWHLLYGISVLGALAVAGEINVMLGLALACAWRWSQ
jgi:hypothetical protein